MPHSVSLANRSQPTQLMTAQLPSTYSFECPHCHSILSLPMALEGVTGPCPHCHASITAPPQQNALPPLFLSAFEQTSTPPPQIQNAAFDPVAQAAPIPPQLTQPVSAPVPTWLDLVGEMPAESIEFPAQVEPFSTHDFSRVQSSASSQAPPERSLTLRLALFAGIAAAATGVYLLFNPPASGRPPLPPPPPSAATGSPDTDLSTQVVLEAQPTQQAPTGELPPDEDIPGTSGPVIPRIQSSSIPSLESDPPSAEPPNTQIETPEIRRAKPEPTPSLLIDPDLGPIAKVTDPSPFEPSTTPPSPSILEEPRAVLEAFLAASNWQQRLILIQHADKLRSKIANYYTNHSDGSVKTDSVDFLTSQPTPNGDEVFYLFNVQMHGGHAFPVAVEKMDGSYRIDWESFVEFKDLLLPQFFKTYSPEPASFHVVLERKHYFGTDVANQDRKLCFSVEPPVPGFSNYAWVSNSDLELITKLGVRAEFGQTSYPIITLRWVKESNGTAYVIFENIRSDNWRSDLVEETPSNGTTPAQEKPRDKASEKPPTSIPKRAKIVK